MLQKISIILICTALLFTSCIEPSETTTPSASHTSEDIMINEPGDLELDAVSGATLAPSIELDWTDNSDNEEGFEIERSESVDFNTIETFTTDADIEHYLNKGVTPEQPYYYRIRAFKGDDTSVWSETGSITFYYPLPDNPTDAVASRLTNTSCWVNWTDNAYCENGFTVEYSLSSDFSATETIFVGEDVTGCTLEDLDSENYYYIRIRAENNTGSSDWSNTAEVDLTATAAPVAPTDAIAVKLGNNCFRAEWTDNSTDETGFSIQYSLNSDFSSSTTKSVDANETHLVIDGLIDNSLYYYKVRSIKGGETSSWSNTVTTDLSTPDANTLTFDFTDGTAGGYSKIYTIWIEDSSGNFLKNINVCTRINLQNLTGTALPYWEMNKRSSATEEEIDAVTSATIKNDNFKKYTTLTGLPDNFTVCFEVDHSFDPNAWFDNIRIDNNGDGDYNDTGEVSKNGDQPAILYKIDVDLNNGTDFNAEPDAPFGWTPNNNTNSYDDYENTIPGMNVNAGELQDSPEYIIYESDGSTLDSRRSTKLVGALKVTINN